MSPDAEHPLVTTLLTYYRAEERYVADGCSDVTQIAALLHPDVVIKSAASLFYGGVWRGVDGFARFLAAFTAQWADLEVADPRLLPVGDDTVVAMLTMRARSRRTGARQDAPLCQVNRFRDGLLVEVVPFYWDTAHTNRVLGHSLSDGDGPGPCTDGGHPVRDPIR